MFWSEVGEPLQMIFLGEKTAEAFHGLVVSGTGAEAALTAVAVELVQLGTQVFIMAHCKILSKKDTAYPVADRNVSGGFPCFPDDILEKVLRISNSIRN